MLSHGIVNAIAVTGQLSLIDGITNAIGVQVAKNKGDLEQEIVFLSQLHVFAKGNANLFLLRWR
jgi:hypothetical protein